MEISIVVSYSGELMIKAGDVVDFNTTLVRRKVQEPVKLPVATSLGIEPGKIFLHLTRVVGDRIGKGDAIASRKGLFSTKSYRSEFTGVIREIDHTDGTIVIDVDSARDENIRCYFKGEITSVKKNVVTLKVKNSKDFPLKFAEEDFGGQMLNVKNEAGAADLNEDQIKDKVVVIERLTEYEQRKIEALGATGFVSLHMLSDTIAPTATTKTIADWKDIAKSDLPYCIIDKKTSTIYLYE